MTFIRQRANRLLYLTLVRMIRVLAIIALLISVAQARASEKTLAKFEDFYQEYKLLRYSLQSTTSRVEPFDLDSVSNRIRKLRRDFSTNNGIQALRIIQNRRASMRAQKDRVDSILSLRQLKNNPEMISKFCRNLPLAASLHNHSSGIIDRTLLKQLLDKSNPIVDGRALLEEVDRTRNQLYSEERNYLQSLYPAKSWSVIDNQNCFLNLFFLGGNKIHPFERFEAVFQLIGIAYENRPWEDVQKEIYENFLRKNHSHGLQYVEVITSLPPLDPTTHALMERVVQSVEVPTSISLNWNYGIRRRSSIDSNRQAISELIQAKKLELLPHVVGVDIIGDEEAFSFAAHGLEHYLRIKAAKIDLKLTAHAGERGTVEDLYYVLLSGLDRIEHGVNFARDPLLLEVLARDKTPVVVNLSSNLILGVTSNHNKHPFLYMHRIGVPISFSTDDEGIFETDISQECMIIIQNSDISYAELIDMVFSSISASFATEDEKIQMSLRFMESLTSFQAFWKHRIGR